MKNLIPLVVFFVSLLSSCAKEKIGNVKITFTNTSKFDYLDLEVLGRHTGLLKAGAISSVIQFSKFKFDSGKPDENIQCFKIDKIAYYVGMSGFCATEKSTKTNGEYHLNVNWAEYPNGDATLYFY